MRKERFQVRISSNGFSETFFSLFNFQFSILCVSSANTLFNFQLSISLSAITFFYFRIPLGLKKSECNIFSCQITMLPENILELFSNGIS